MADHAGELIAEEIEYRGYTIKRFAKRHGLDARWLGDLAAGRTRITRIAAKELSRALGTSENVWLELQRLYEKREAADE